MFFDIVLPFNSTFFAISQRLSHCSQVAAGNSSFKGNGGGFEKCYDYAHYQLFISLLPQNH
jgi:hypothetical protein